MPLAFIGTYPFAMVARRSSQEYLADSRHFNIQLLTKLFLRCSTISHWLWRRSSPWYRISIGQMWKFSGFPDSAMVECSQSWAVNWMDGFPPIKKTFLYLLFSHNVFIICISILGSVGSSYEESSQSNRFRLRQESFQLTATRIRSKAVTANMSKDPWNQAGRPNWFFHTELCWKSI